MPTSFLADPPAAPAPPWRQSRYAPTIFFQHNPAGGTIADALSRRVIVSPADLIAAIHRALTAEVGDAAAEIWHKLGTACGAADMRAFADRAAGEFGVELAKVHMGVALQTWWWPWAASGWGHAEFDLQRAAQRIVRIDVHSGLWTVSSGQQELSAHSSLPTALCSCHLLAGLFAGAFGQLSGRAVACVEVQCRAAGAADCRFLVTTRNRAASAAEWRTAGVTADEIERRVAEQPASDSSKDRRP